VTYSVSAAAAAAVEAQARLQLLTCFRGDQLVESTTK
jgi:hypothetical protein